jgi:Amt family ammonium transporter
MDGYYAFMLVASSLVLMMTTPALALFYGGMSRSKSVLNMMMMSFGAMAVVGIVYVLWGWSMSFAGTDVGTLFGNPFTAFGLEGVGPDSPLEESSAPRLPRHEGSLLSDACVKRRSA